MSDILLAHNNFPAQFAPLLQPLAAQGHRLAALAAKTAPGARNVDVHHWSHTRGSTPGIFPAATRAEADMIRGYAAGEAAERLRKTGFDPSLIIGHPGWGETLFLQQVFPRARQIVYAEFFYGGPGGDADFDAEFGLPGLPERFRHHAKSATLALAYAQADALVAPTRFQGERLPPGLRQHLHVIHEGVRTDLIIPRAEAQFRLDASRTLDRSTPVVTFVSRVLEPMRGFHVFMRALPDILRCAPAAEILVIGREIGPGYGAEPPSGKTWKSLLLEELGSGLDLNRVHFTGPLTYQNYLDALAVSAAHVYLTYPFALSWSLIEAMACGCAIIASDTAPVLDALDDTTAALVNFFDPAALAEAVLEACTQPFRFASRREAARQAAVAHFDRERVCLPAWLALVDDLLASGRLPSAADPTGRIAHSAANVA